MEKHKKYKLPIDGQLFFLIMQYSKALDKPYMWKWFHALLVREPLEGSNHFEVKGVR